MEAGGEQRPSPGFLAQPCLCPESSTCADRCFLPSATLSQVHLGCTPRLLRTEALQSPLLTEAAAGRAARAWPLVRTSRGQWALQLEQSSFGNSGAFSALLKGPHVGEGTHCPALQTQLVTGRVGGVRRRA